jgi:hypothetical protein
VGGAEERCKQRGMLHAVSGTIHLYHVSLITHPVDFMYYLPRFKITVCSVNLNSLPVTVGGV